MVALEDTASGPRYAYAVLYPLHDTLPDPPEDWDDIPLGAGQEPNAYGGPGSFQWRRGADSSVSLSGVPDDLRRKPGEEPIFISRPPERP